MPERRVRIDLKEGVKRTLPGRRRIAFVVELDAEFALDVQAGVVFLLRLVLDNARKQDFARHGGIGAHQRPKTRRAQDSVTEPSLNTAFWPQRPGRQPPSRKTRHHHATASL